MLRVILFLLVFCVQLLPLSHAVASITGITGPKCNNVPAVIQGRSQDFTIRGEWVDWANNKSRVSGRGVRLRIISKRAAGKNSTVVIRLTANANAATGVRRVTLRYPSGQDRFNLRVIPRASITRARVPSFTQPFQNNVDVTLEGVSLNNITSVNAVLVNDSFNPVLDAGGQPLSGGVVVRATVNQRTNSRTRAVVRLNFTRRLSRARVELQLRSTNGCSGIGNTVALSRTVTISAPATGPNYVDEITFPFGSSFTVGSVATIEVKLERPVRAPLRVSKKRPLLRRNQGDIVFWKVIPADAFVQAPGGTPYNPNAFNRITIPPGDESQRITIRVRECPRGNAVSPNRTVKIQTWRLNTNTTQPPNFKEKLFSISCPQ